MSNLHLGVQSISFRDAESAEDLCQKIRQAGFDRVELWSRHLERWPDLPERLHRAEIIIQGLGIARLGEPHNDQRWIAMAQRCGAAYLSSDYDVQRFPEGISATAALAREGGISLALHNHGAPHWLGNRRMLERFLDIAPPEFSLCLDTAWALDSREDPIALAHALAPRLRAVHIKDFIFDQGRSPREILPGDGGLILPELLKVLYSCPNPIDWIVETEAPGLRAAEARIRVLTAWKNLR